jgi:hypothetical protein
MTDRAGIRLPVISLSSAFSAPNFNVPGKFKLPGALLRLLLMGRTMRVY